MSNEALNECPECGKLVSGRAFCSKRCRQHYYGITERKAGSIRSALAGGNRPSGDPWERALGGGA